MKMNNFFLLIKQGLKGVFRYKTQFVLIVILGFFASLILSVTSSINDRINFEYERTMQKVEPFDFYSEDALETIGSVDSKNMVPIIDFISDEYLRDLNGNAIAYNVNIANVEGNKETFITKALKDYKFEKAFNSLIQKPDYYQPWFNYKFSDGDEKPYFNAYGLNSSNSNIDETNYWYQISKLVKAEDINYSPVEVYTNDTSTGYYVAKQMEEFTNQTIHLLKEKLKIEIDDSNSNFRSQNSTFASLVNKGILKSEDIVSNFGNYHYSKLSKFQREVNTYIDFAFVSIVYQMNKMIHDYVQYWMDEAIEVNKENPNTNNVITEFKKLSQLDSLENKNQDILYKWMFSENFSGENKTGNVYKDGTKGQLIHADEKGNVQDKGDALKLISNGKYLENILKDKNNFIKKDNYRYENANVASSYYIRQNLIAQASELDIYSRMELLYSDNSSEKHFRFVLMDEWVDKNVTVYQGNKPRIKNEVLVNSQYAKANHISLGSNIKVGQVNLTVSGFAADPYTNFPVAEITVPFPNNKKGVIIYLNKNIVNDVITRNEAKVVTTNLYRFITSKNRADLDRNISRFKSLNYNYLENLKADNENNEGKTKITYPYLLKEFKSSVFSINWLLMPLVLKTFSTIAYIVCSIILAICIITMLIAIKKTIQFNSGEIGILKALGTKTGQIAVSYISYGLVLLLIIVPITWFIGGYVQELFSVLFISYTGGSYNQAWFNPEAFGILMLLFGLVTIFISYITAYILIRKPVLEIFNKKEVVKRIQWLDALKLKLTKRTKFTTKFSIELAISGFKPTLLSTFTILVATFLVVTSMSIPGMVNTAVNSYYKNVKYSNQIENLEPIGNSPLSKTSLSAWNGVDYYEQYLNNVKGTYGIVDYLSDSITDVTGPTDYSLLPKFLFRNDGQGNLNANWTYDTLSQNGELIKMIGYLFGSGLPQTIGRGINIADIQRVVEWLAHDGEKSFENTQDRIKRIDELTSLLSEGLPPILKSIFPAEVNDEDASNWKDYIIAAILSETPSYVKSYLNKSENRYNQYSFGWTFINYIPGEDDFYTSTKFITKQNKQMSLMGVQSNQKAYNLKDNSNKMYLDSESLNNLEKVLKGDLTQDITTKNGFKLYSNGTLNIPVTLNDQARFKMNSTKTSSFELKDFIAKRFVMSQDGVNIPNSAWVYDDADWINLSKSSTSREGLEQNRYLDPTKLDTSKFTFARSYEYGSDRFTFKGAEKATSIKDYAKGFANFYTEGRDLKTEVRPYYNYDNLFLIAPKTYEKSLTALKIGAKNNEWYGDMNTKDVPIQTKNQWEKTLNAQVESYIWIRPYSLTYDSDYEEQEIGGEIVNLLAYKNSFMRQNLLESKPGMIDKDIQMNWNLKNINLVPVSSVDVYGKNVILADQGLTNLVHGYSKSQYIPYNYVFEKEQKGSYKLANDQVIKTYTWNTAKDLSDRNIKDQIWGNNEQKSYSPSTWFTGIMSQSKEPYFLTSQASFSKKIRTGEFTLGGESKYNDTVEMESVEFLTEQRALINQIANLVLTIAISFIVVIIITATLSMIIITDLYVNQYRKFMIVMKFLGYSNWKVIKYSFDTVTLLALLALLLGILGSIVVVTITGNYVKTNVGSIPLGLSWWALLISITLLITSFIGSIMITTYKIRKESSVSLMK